MRIHLARRRLWIALFLIVIAIFLVVISRQAFWQEPDTVVIREPGRRFLGPPQPAQFEATNDLDYAMLSQVAYGDIEPDKPAKKEPCIDAKKILENEGWSRVPNFPGEDLEKEMKVVHLRAEFWAHRSTSSVVVAFGGTVFSSTKDWKSNLHWFNPFQHDEYSLVVREFSHQFAEMIAKQQEMPDWEFLHSATIYSTGHSLGGGLAEEFAYSLPINGPHVSKVYAFDPSPVSGFLSVNRDIRNKNKTGLQIDRIYERGEVLAILRSITSTIHKPPAVNPQVRQIRYNLFGFHWFGLTNFVAGHSIQDLVCGIRKVAGR